MYLPRYVVAFRQDDSYCCISNHYGGRFRIKLHELKRYLQICQPKLEFVVLRNFEFDHNSIDTYTDWEYELKKLEGKTDVFSLLQFLTHGSYGIGPSPEEAVSMLLQQAISVEEVDHTLITFKRLYRWDSEIISDETYFKMLQRGIRLAMKTADPSLLETVIYSLGTLAPLYPQLLKLAKSIDDPRVKRALGWLSFNS